MVETICQYCNKKFNAYPSRLKEGKSKFCSKLCATKGSKGRINWNRGLTKETDERIKNNSIARVGHKYPEELYPNRGMRGKRHKLIGSFKKCLVCGKEVYVSPYYKDKKKYCSKKCKNIAFKGHPAWGCTKMDKYKFKKGHTSWNKGLAMPEHLKEKLIKIHLGKKQSKETIEKRRKSMNEFYANGGRSGMFGKTQSEKAKIKISENNSKYWKGKSWTFPENVKKIMKENRKKQIFPVKDSSIELKIQGFLTLLRIEFFTHKYINIEHGYQCDILIPVQEGITQKTIIECDGDYFHCNPLKYSKDFVRFPNSKDNQPACVIWEKDKIRTKELQEKGFRVIRLWEHEIKQMEVNDLRSKIYGI